MDDVVKIIRVYGFNIYRLISLQTTLYIWLMINLYLWYKYYNTLNYIMKRERLIMNKRNVLVVAISTLMLVLSGCGGKEPIPTGNIIPLVNSSNGFQVRALPYGENSALGGVGQVVCFEAHDDLDTPQVFEGNPSELKKIVKSKSSDANMSYLLEIKKSLVKLESLAMKSIEAKGDEAMYGFRGKVDKKVTATTEQKIANNDFETELSALHEKLDKGNIRIDIISDSKDIGGGIAAGGEDTVSFGVDANKKRMSSKFVIASGFTVETLVTPKDLNTTSYGFDKKRCGLITYSERAKNVVYSKRFSIASAVGAKFKLNYETLSESDKKIFEDLLNLQLNYYNSKLANLTSLGNFENGTISATKAVFFSTMDSDFGSIVRAFGTSFGILESFTDK